VQTGLLEVLLDNQGVREIDMLKMDIEGAEALVLPTMTKDFPGALQTDLAGASSDSTERERGSS